MGRGIAACDCSIRGACGTMQAMRTLTVLAVAVGVFVCSGVGQLRVSLPPSFGAIPVVMGVTWGLFAEEGVEVELVPLPSSADRQLAFQAGQVHVMVSDLTTAVILVASPGTPGVIVGTAYVPETDAPYLALITPTGVTKMTTWEEFAARVSRDRGTQLGIIKKSDYAFAVEELLAREGLSLPIDNYVGVDNLLQSAIWLGLGLGPVVYGLPQPYADYLATLTLGESTMLTVLQWVPGEDMPPEVVVFRRDVVDSQPELVAAFFRGLRRAVERLNSEDRDRVVADVLPVAVNLFFPGGGPETADAETRDRIESAIAAVAIPRFSEPMILDPDVYERVMAWVVAKKWVRAASPYDSTVVPPPG